ncbi:LiaF transmembrane domain-containing protein [Alkaliphilus peptidifermentans]|uniref:LiaF transmembrane domain-containing protein n=1 Tax=Alkaliphilus peptidifermentans DSM 18978 TaxID=1120976 RepID=A0A1G5GK23_9FIRM|nr:hypothetical protein [Alkaliphilus peptidifermentans]SCY51731.1 hypothetical protein SAMN03080606_01715 [Alkaliphilus peptidifermentans DSM 18978]
MRQWRVGTFSMGIILIALGIILIISMVGGNDIASNLLKWWPIILIILGLEILTYLFLSKEDGPVIKYDVFSIVLIIFIFIFSTLVYTLTTIGIVPKLTEMVSSRNYMVEMNRQEVQVDSEVKKIVLESPRYNVQIKSGEENRVILWGQGEVYTLSKDMADDIINKSELVTNQVGDTLYVSFNEMAGMTDFNGGVSFFSYTLCLPSNVDVEINRGRGYRPQIDIDAGIIDGKWAIDTQGRIIVRTTNQLDLSIEALVNGRDWLRGNANWQTEKSDTHNQVLGELQFGNGTNRLTIFSGEVEVLHVN